jgi:hypothetical protein
MGPLLWTVLAGAARAREGSAEEKTMRSAIVLSGLVGVLITLAFVGCKSEEDGAGNEGGAGGTTGVIDVGGAGSGGEGGETDGMTLPPCETLIGLDEDCGSTTAAAKVLAPNILIVIDKSGSMVDQPEGFATDKWQALKTALSEALDNAQGVAFGLEFFPPASCAEGCCPLADGDDAIDVPIAPAATSVPLIKAAFDATGPGGGTPTADALSRAYDYFTTGAGKDLKGERYVLLATDGGPNCNADLTCGDDPDKCTVNLDGECELDDQGNVKNCCVPEGPRFNISCLDDVRTVEQITKLAAQGIPTFVVGIPGTEAYSSYLDAFARAGTVPSRGTTDYYAVTAELGVGGLTDVLRDITTQLVRGCDIELSSIPPKTDLVNVAINCEVVKRAEGDATNWQLITSSEPPRIELVGEVCDWIKTNGAQRVDVLVGCPTVR